MRLVFLSFLCAVPLAAREPLLPPPASDEAAAPTPIAPVDRVPLPSDAELFDAAALAPAEPKSVNLLFSGGFDYDKPTETVISRGALEATADTGMTLAARQGRYETQAGKIYFEGAVKLRTEKGSEILADRAVLNDAAQTVTLTGDVSIYQGQSLQRARSAVYNIATGESLAAGLRTGFDPIFLESDQFELQEENGKPVWVGRGAGVTTHDVAEPDYWLRSDETRVYPDDRVTFRNLKLYAGDVPVLWLPYLSQPLDSQLGYHFVPGARSNLGPFLLNRYGIMLGGDRDEEPWLLSRWLFDIRGRRGAALGLDLIDRRVEENPNLLGLSLYYANDLAPTITRNGLIRPAINEDRWEASLQHRLDFAWETDANWRLDANLHALSDDFFLEDFDPRLFQTDPAPDNTLSLFRADDTSLLGVITRYRANDFYRTDQRFPEIIFDQVRRPLFDTPVLHESQTSLSIVEESFGNRNLHAVRTALALPPGAQLNELLLRLPAYEQQLVTAMRGLPPADPALNALRTQLFEPGYSRFHTYHEFSLPLHFGNWLQLTPEAGLGYSRYDHVNGPFDALSRTHLYAGAEASTKFSKNYDAVANRRWGVNRMLHVIQPYLRLSSLSTDDLDPLFPAVDRDTFNTRPRSLALSRYPAIDSLRDWSILRLGIRNELITRRDERSYQWLYLDTYIDKFFNDPDFDRNFSNLFNDLTWRPLPWFALQFETQLPVIDQGSGFSDAATFFQFMPNENVEFGIGHRFLNNHPIFIDSNRIEARGYVRLNDDWGFGAAQTWETDDGTLEFQQYTVHRDFSHWTTSLGIMTRDNRFQNEYGFVLAIALRDFPDSSLPLRLDTQ